MSTKPTKSYVTEYISAKNSGKDTKAANAAASNSVFNSNTSNNSSTSTSKSNNSNISVKTSYASTYKNAKTLGYSTSDANNIASNTIFGTNKSVSKLDTRTSQKKAYDNALANYNSNKNKETKKALNQAKKNYLLSERDFKKDDSKTKITGLENSVNYNKTLLDQSIYELNNSKTQEEYNRNYSYYEKAYNGYISALKNYNNYANQLEDSGYNPNVDYSLNSLQKTGRLIGATATDILAGVSGTIANKFYNTNKKTNKLQYGTTVTQSDVKRISDKYFGGAKSITQEQYDSLPDDAKSLLDAQYVGNVNKFNKVLDRYYKNELNYKINDAYNQQVFKDFESDLAEWNRKAQEKFAEASATINDNGAVGKANRFLYELAPSIGGNLVDKYVSGATDVDSKLIMAGRIFGSSYAEAISEGKNIGTAAAYGLASAGVEYLTESISGLGNGGIYGEGAIDKVVKKAISKIPSKFLAKSALWLSGNLGETSEELISEFCSPLIDALLEENPDLTTYIANVKQLRSEQEAEDYLMAGLGGFVSSMLLTGLDGLTTRINNKVNGTNNLSNLDAELQSLGFAAKAEKRAAKKGTTVEEEYAKMKKGYAFSDYNGMSSGEDINFDEATTDNEKNFEAAVNHFNNLDAIHKGIARSQYIDVSQKLAFANSGDLIIDKNLNVIGKVVYKDAENGLIIAINAGNVNKEVYVPYGILEDSSIYTILSESKADCNIVSEENLIKMRSENAQANTNETEEEKAEHKANDKGEKRYNDQEDLNDFLNQEAYNNSTKSENNTQNTTQNTAENTAQNTAEEQTTSEQNTTEQAKQEEQQTTQNTVNEEPASEANATAEQTTEENKTAEATATAENNTNINEVPTNEGKQAVQPNESESEPKESKQSDERKKYYEKRNREYWDSDNGDRRKGNIRSTRSDWELRGRLPKLLEQSRRAFADKNNSRESDGVEKSSRGISEQKETVLNYLKNDKGLIFDENTASYNAEDSENGSIIHFANLIANCFHINDLVIVYDSLQRKSNTNNININGINFYREGITVSKLNPKDKTHIIKNVIHESFHYKISSGTIENTLENLSNLYSFAINDKNINNPYFVNALNCLSKEYGYSEINSNEYNNNEQLYRNYGIKFDIFNNYKLVEEFCCRILSGETTFKTSDNTSFTVPSKYVTDLRKMLVKNGLLSKDEYDVILYADETIRNKDFVDYYDDANSFYSNKYQYLSAEEIEKKLVSYFDKYLTTWHSASKYTENEFINAVGSLLTSSNLVENTNYKNKDISIDISEDDIEDIKALIKAAGAPNKYSKIFDKGQNKTVYKKLLRYASYLEENNDILKEQKTADILFEEKLEQNEEYKHLLDEIKQLDEDFIDGLISEELYNEKSLNFSARIASIKEEIMEDAEKTFANIEANRARDDKSSGIYNRYNETQFSEDKYTEKQLEDAVKNIYISDSWITLGGYPIPDILNKDGTYSRYSRTYKILSKSNIENAKKILPKHYEEFKKYKNILKDIKESENVDKDLIDIAEKNYKKALRNYVFTAQRAFAMSQEEMDQIKKADADKEKYKAAIKNLTNNSVPEDVKAARRERIAEINRKLRAEKKELQSLLDEKNKLIPVINKYKTGKKKAAAQARINEINEQLKKFDNINNENYELPYITEEHFVDDNKYKEITSNSDFNKLSKEEASKLYNDFLRLQSLGMNNIKDDSVQTMLTVMSNETDSDGNYLTKAVVERFKDALNASPTDSDYFNLEIADDQTETPIFGDKTESIKHASQAFDNTNLFYSKLTEEQLKYGKYKDSLKSVNTLQEYVRDVSTGVKSISELATYYRSLKENPFGTIWYSDRVNNLLDKAVYARNIEDDNFNELADRAIKALVHEVRQKNGSSKDKIEISKSITQNKKMGKYLSGWVEKQLTASNVFRAIDGFKKDRHGVGYKYQERIDNAILTKIETETEAKNLFAKLTEMDGYNDFANNSYILFHGSEPISYNGHVFKVQDAISFVKAIDTLGGVKSLRANNINGFSFQKSDGSWENVDYKIKSYDHYGNYEDVDPEKALEEAYNWLTDALIKDEVANAYVGAMDAMFKYFRYGVQKTNADVNGYEINMYKDGKYYPIFYKSRNVPNDGTVLEWNLNAEDPLDHSPSYAKERTRNFGGYVAIQPTGYVADRYIKQASDWVAFGKLGKDMALLNTKNNVNESLSYMLKNYLGEGFADWTDKYIDTLNNIDTKGTNEFLDKANSKLQQGALLFSISVPLKQISSYWDIIGVIDPDVAIRAFRPKVMNAKDNTNVLGVQSRRYGGGLDWTVADALNNKNSLVGRWREKSAAFRKATDAISTMDYRTVSNVYDACVRQIMKDYPGYDESKPEMFQRLVDAKFDECLLYTQPIYTKQARSELGRTNDSLIKSLSLFKTQSNQNFNNLFRYYMEYKAADPGHKKEALKDLKTVIGGQIASAISLGALTLISNIILHKKDKYTDDDGNFSIGKAFSTMSLSTIESLAGNFWLADNAVKMFIDWFTKKLSEKFEGVEATKEFYGINAGAISAFLGCCDDFAELMSDPSIYGVKNFIFDTSNSLGVPARNIYQLLSAGFMHGMDIARAFGDENDAKQYSDVISYLASESIIMPLSTSTQKSNILVNAYLNGNTNKYERIKNNYLVNDAAEEAVIKAAGREYAKNPDNVDKLNYLLEDIGKDSSYIEDKNIDWAYKEEYGESYKYSDVEAEYLETGDISTAREKFIAAGLDEDTVTNHVKDLQLKKKYGYTYSEANSKYLDGKLDEPTYEKILNEYYGGDSEKVNNKLITMNYRKEVDRDFDGVTTSTNNSLPLGYNALRDAGYSSKDANSIISSIDTDGNQYLKQDEVADYAKRTGNKSIAQAIWLAEGWKKNDKYPK